VRIVAEPNYAALAKEAAEAVKDLKEPAYSIAYAKILDDLIARAKQKGTGPEPRHGLGGKTPPEISTADPTAVFLAGSFDAAPYADLFLSKGQLLMKCLAVLKLARDEFGIDGLGPADLETILRERFRTPGVHRGNIHRDLGKALKFVSRVVRDGRPVYMLMAPGEEALKQTVSGLTSP